LTQVFHSALGISQQAQEPRIVGRSSPNSWTPEETSLLTSLVKQMKDQSWVTIAKALNTGKTGGQCSQHWTRVANPAIKKGMWDAGILVLFLGPSN